MGCCTGLDSILAAVVESDVLVEDEHGTEDEEERSIAADEAVMWFSVRVVFAPVVFACIAIRSGPQIRWEGVPGHTSFWCVGVLTF